jgi:hypothetical protein
MADLEDLNYQGLTDLSNDEAIELLRQIRLSRRTPIKQQVKKTTPKQQRKAKQAPNVTPEQAAELLKILGG